VEYEEVVLHPHPFHLTQWMQFHRWPKERTCIFGYIEDFYHKLLLLQCQEGDDAELILKLIWTNDKMWHNWKEWWFHQCTRICISYNGICKYGLL
jgi:hypothetical protein